MKHLLTLTLYLIATGSPLTALADKCDNLRNNQQAYRDCVNDWYGTRQGTKNGENMRWPFSPRTRR